MREILLDSDPEIAENELIFPTDAVRKKLYPYPAFTSSEEAQVIEAMTKVTGG